uniref:Membrane transporter protein n=1 Tax=Steinernema glaseri TaxID=37863 RepID=A0A1I7ZF68_9BILA
MLVAELDTAMSHLQMPIQAETPHVNEEALGKNAAKGRRSVREFFRKYFLEGQTLEESVKEQRENIPADAAFDEIVLIKYRKFIAFLVPFLVAQSIWWLTAWKMDFFSLYPTHWHMPVTMILGATVAGMTSEGGGAVAFPVMTFILHIDPTTARDFSLMIQSVAMTLSLFVIVFMQIQIEWRAIILATVGAIPGVIIGFTTIDPMFTGPQKKMMFVSCWCAFAISLWILNTQKKRTTYPKIPDFSLWKALVLIATGFAGGILDSMAGSGVDICTFSVVTLLFRLSEKTATPTTVVLMGLNSMIAFYWRAVMMGDIAQLAWDYLKVTVPVSVTFAPFGSFLGSHFHRLVLAAAIYVLEAAALVGFLFTKPSGSLLLAGALIIIGGFVFFSLLSKLGEWLMESIEAKERNMEMKGNRA